MLVLSREAGESIMLGDDIEIVVVRTGTEKVRIGIQAPKEVAINRREVYDAIQRNGGVDLKPRGGKQHPTITPINPERNDEDLRHFLPREQSVEASGAGYSRIPSPANEATA